LATLAAPAACNTASFKNGPVGDPPPETCYEGDCLPPQPDTSGDAGPDADAADGSEAEAADGDGDG
jgi:hypothetical protein